MYGCNYNCTMLATLLILFLTIAGWTAITWFRQGESREEIRSNLKNVSNNLSESIKSIGNLIMLLFKETLKGKINKENNQANGSKEPQKVASSTVAEETEVLNIDSLYQKSEEDDEALVGFSSEVVELITEEEEKAA